jgi:large subunit ribosomal protein L30e
MEIAAAIKRISETGKMVSGSREVKDNIENGRARAVIVAANCPKKTRRDIEHRAGLAGTPVIEYPGTSLQLGEACGKPFVIASISVTDLGSVPLAELKGAKR